jgi:hypothetical protein
VDYEAIRRQREAVAAARAERERLRQERIAREAEEKAQKERNKVAEEALKMWEKEDAAALAPKKKSGGLSPLLRKSQKLPCAFCENGWRDCPWCEGSKVQCSRSGCINGQEICGCVKMANNYQPDPNCPHCYGKGMNICEACKGKGSWPCTHCGGAGKLPCLHCQGLKMASSSMDIQPTAIGSTSVPRPMSPLAEAQQVLAERILGPDSSPADVPQKELDRLKQAQKKMAETDQRLAQEAIPVAPSNAVPATLEQSQSALADRELELIQQVIDANGGKVPAFGSLAGKALAERIKKAFAADPAWKRLKEELKKQEASVLPSSSGSVLVPSFNAVVTPPPSAKPAVSGPLGAKVSLTDEQLRATLRKYEEYVWWQESRMLRNGMALCPNAPEIIARDAAYNRAEADYEKLKSKPGAPATLDAFIEQRRSTYPDLQPSDDPDVRRIIAGHYLANSTLVMQSMALKQKASEYKELIDSSPAAPRIAAEIRQESMNRRIGQLENLMEEEKKKLAEVEREEAERLRKEKELWSAYGKMKEAARPKAREEYERLSEKQKADMEFDTFLYVKTLPTPEAQAVCGKDAMFHQQFDDLSTSYVNMARHQLQETQAQLQTLRQRGTLLDAPSSWYSTGARLRPYEQPDTLELFNDLYDFTPLVPAKNSK